MDLECGDLFHTSRSTQRGLEGDLQVTCKPVGEEKKDFVHLRDVLCGPIFADLR